MKEFYNKQQTLYEQYVKRSLDIICAILAIVIFGWLYLIIAILVRIKLGSPVLFTQLRSGKNEKMFKMYKFRTMTEVRNESGELLPDEARLTSFGKWLRTTSLDELPEVFNIIKGDMSIIGPRPLVSQYLPYYTEEERHRHDVRPGLSGWAQVNGRNSVSWEDRFKFDVEYVQRITFLGDLKIVFLSIITALTRQDIGVRGVDAPMDFDVYRRQQLKEQKK